jgi:LysR family hca operon transcriptional activator
MELRHLRYFVAVAEEGSLTVAAEKRLHTAQPSLSRQIRDLEYEIGAALLTRSARGIELTPAGEAFLPHARMALAQVEAATAAARRAAKPPKANFVVGFLTGHEMEWLPAAMQILQANLPEIEVTIASQPSPEMAQAVARGEADIAFIRPEPNIPELDYKLLTQEPLVFVLPSDHRLAASPAIGLDEIADEPFILVSHTAPVLRAVIDDYLQTSGVKITPDNEADNLSMAISLVASTRGIAILPVYAQNFLPWSVTSRPIKGEVPHVDLVLAYHKENASPVLADFLSRLDTLIALATKKAA